MAGEIPNALPRVDIPQLDKGIPRRADDEISTNGNRIDWPAVAGKLAEEFTGLAVPNTHGGILRARDNILLVKAHVKNPGCVVRQSHQRGIRVYRPDYASVIRRPGDQDFLIELQAQDGCAMVIGGA